MEHQMKTYLITQRVNRLVFAAATGAALIASLALVPTAFAQGQGAPPQGQGQGREGGRGQRVDPQQMMDRRIATLTEKLQLNSSQQTKIRAILSDERTQMEALRKNAVNRGDDRQGPPPDRQRPDSGRAGERGPRGDRGGPPPEVRAIRDKTEKQIEGVLNASQLTTYRQLQQQRQQERARHEGESHKGERTS
jgi:hypothetical protein